MKHTAVPTTRTDDEPARAMRDSRRLRLRVHAVACAVLLLVVPTSALGYGGDTHYYLSFSSSLAACFDWDEAHLIASANYLVDKNGSTTAEKHPLQTHNKINWHAFGKDEERFNALWESVLAEPDPILQLVKLG